MPKVILVNPSMTTVGYSVITPRWLFVIGQATPTELVIPSSLMKRSRNSTQVWFRRGDIVGMGISTGNCRAGYKILKKARSQGATVIMGDIHPTIFPDEHWKWVPTRSSPAMEISSGARP